MTHICVTKLTSIGPDNGLSPGRRQDIIWNNAGILLIRISDTNFGEMLSETLTFSIKKCIWKYRLQNCGNFVSASMCNGPGYRMDMVWFCCIYYGRTMIQLCGNDYCWSEWFQIGHRIHIGKEIICWRNLWNQIYLSLLTPVVSVSAHTKSVQASEALGFFFNKLCSTSFGYISRLGAVEVNVINP